MSWCTHPGQWHSENPETIRCSESFINWFRAVSLSLSHGPCHRQSASVSQSICLCLCVLLILTWARSSVNTVTVLQSNKSNNNKSFNNLILSTTGLLIWLIRILAQETRLGWREGAAASQQRLGHPDPVGILSCGLPDLIGPAMEWICNILNKFYILNSRVIHIIICSFESEVLILVTDSNLTN